MYQYKTKPDGVKANRRKSEKSASQASIRSNNMGIPLQMKERFESVSGLSFDDVKIHYNSDKPAKLKALAYTQGNQVYIGPGQEKHLSHELGHVVQQKLGIVRPTARIGNLLVNDDPALEKAADTLPVFAAGSSHSFQEGAVLQRMPWHMKESFPSDKLILPGAGEAPATPITGYKFIGYTYSSHKEREFADQDLATVGAANDLAEIGASLPSNNNILGAKEIANYRNRTSSAEGESTFAQEKDIITDHRNVLANNYAKSLAIPNYQTDPPAYDWAKTYPVIKGMWDAYMSSDTNDFAAVRNAVMAVANYSQLRKKDKEAISSSSDIGELKAALIEAAQFFSKNKTKDFRDYEKSERSHAAGGGPLQKPDDRTRNSALNSIDPFQIQIRSKIKTLSSETAFNIHYQFSKDSYGYVVRIDKGANTAYMANGIEEVNVPNCFYSSSHNTTDDSLISATANSAVTGNAQKDSIAYDAVTKLAGEGARWQCVRANAAKLKNATKFYTEDSGVYHFITFENLWKSWRSFNNKYSIPNSEVINKLKSTADGNLDFNKESSRDPSNIAADAIML